MHCQARLRRHRSSTCPITALALAATVLCAAAVAATPAGEGPAATPLPFGGFRLDSLAEQVRLADPRHPWGPLGSAADPVDAAKLAAHEAALVLAMNRVQALQGRASTQPLKDFDAIWAPFFQHPTAQNHAYFERLAPALEDYISAGVETEALAPAYRSSLVDLAEAAASGNDLATSLALSAAQAQAAALEDSRRRQQAALQRIRQLGNPQNPLAAKLAARALHRAALPARPAVPPAPAASSAGPCGGPYGDCEVRQVPHVNIGNQPKAAINPLLKDADPSNTRVVGGPSTPPPPSAAPAAGSNAAAVAEAIGHHLALAQQREDSARRWAADAQREKDPLRQRELQDRAEFDRDMAQTERDLAESLRTGVMVHTRSDWQNQQATRLIVGMQAELADFDKDHQRVQVIPKLAAMVSGPDGVRLQAEIHQRIREAISAPDRGARLDQLHAQLKRIVAAQGAADIARQQAKVAQADANLATAEGIKAGADAAFWAATWLVPGGGTVSLAYGAGVGYAEGGVQQAAENAARAYSNSVDIGLAALRGGLERDESGQRKGLGAAVQAGLSTAVLNKLMNYSAGKATGLIQGGTNKARGGTPGSGGGEPPKPEAFKDNRQRYGDALRAARTPAQQEAVAAQYRIIVARDAMRVELAETTRRHEKALPITAHRADGSVDTGTQAYQQAQVAWQRDMAKVRAKYAQVENRMALHREALAEAFLVPGDIPLSGGEPKSVMSDVDVTPRELVSARKYVQALRKAGHEVQEFPDRWIAPGIDMTIWRPGTNPDKPGSLSYEAAIIHDALGGSDKFPTQGGVEYTTQHGITADAYGAVIANLKKAQEGGIGGEGVVDTHVVSKSLDKALQLAGIDADPRLVSQAQKARAHLTDAEAGITTFGAPPETQARELAQFLARSKAAFADSLHAAGEKSDASAAQLKQQLTDAEGRRDTARAQQIRETLARYRISNEITLQTIANRDPATVAAVLARRTMPPASSRGFGWLNEELTRDRQALARHAAQPLPVLPLPGVAERCRVASSQVAAQIQAARPGSAEAAYLARLKAALERGASNPGQAVTEVRLLSGFELAEVLQQLAPATPR
ncbi:hypothetical protein [Aquabacterium sp.]|uniref:hypothetical protein n=1 Tax=Aquabacterium sp. TaxID=1872578 RepID=UPI003783EAA4